MQPIYGGKSRFLRGAIGKPMAAGDFPSSNYLMDPSRYDYEGNWAFCLFDQPEVPGARFGFGRGEFDTSDYGSTAVPSKDYLQLQIEMMTRDGAILWFGGNRTQGTTVKSNPLQMDVHISSGGKEVFRVSGWPGMDWHFQSEDGDAEVRMRLDLQHACILPDCVLPHNIFAMWGSIAHAEGELRFRDKRMIVSGTAFYDHPRIKVQINNCPPFGWYLYTPIRFSDGSFLIAYHCEDGNGRRVDSYSFGIFIESSGKSHWTDSTAVSEMEMDADGRLKRWRNEWRGSTLSVSATSVVRDTSVLQSWGSQPAPQTRREYENIPLIFDTAAVLEQDGRITRLAGTGLAEYVAHPRSAAAGKLPT